MTQHKLILISTLLFSVPALCGDQGTTSAIRGTVVSAAAGGELLVVPAAQVKLSGPGTFETQSDDTGKYMFASVPPGTYQIDVTAPGLTGARTVTVAAGEEVDTSVQLDVEAVKYSITVSDEAEKAVTAESVGREVITTEIVENSPNRNERLESLLPLIPGVVRGPDGLINMKGARSSQGGSLVNGANVTDPVTGNAAIRLPIDVVSSMQVLVNPYDPEYGKLTGAVATVDTRTGNYEGFHASAQSLFPRVRKRGGDIVGIESFTPRTTLTGPVIKDRLAFTQSFEYRYVRTPVPSLPPLRRDSKLESLDSYSQLDWSINRKQSATVSLSLYPQKLDFLGLGTFTPQPSTPDLHQRGYMTSLQHRYVTGQDSLLVSQFSFKRLDADLTAQSDDPYRLLIETTLGGYYNRQHRETERSEWQETYHFGQVNYWGTHQFKAGFNYSHNSYDGRAVFRPVDVWGPSYRVQRIEFGPASQFTVSQDETAWFASDKWRPYSRLTIDYGARVDHDSVTGATNAAPRAGVAYALTSDNRTILRGGVGIFYDRVILNVPVFPLLPGRTITGFDAKGRVQTSVPYTNVLSSDLRNPRSAAWNLELDRQVLERLAVRVSYQQRNTSRDFVTTPVVTGGRGVLSVSNDGFETYREFQVTGRYQIHKHILNASYVHSKAFGDLNDFNQFFGNTPQVIIQPDQRARLPFDAPNRFLFWGEFAAPRGITIFPLLETHTGFPYSVQDQQRQFIGPRDAHRFPEFTSVDVQVTKDLRLPLIGKAKVGFGGYNLLNHFNPREVQNNLDSDRFGGYYNGVGRTFRGKFVKEF